MAGVRTCLHVRHAIGATRGAVTAASRYAPLRWFSDVQAAVDASIPHDAASARHQAMQNMMASDAVGLRHGRHHEALAAGMVGGAGGSAEVSKTSLIFSVDNSVGALTRVLDLFASHKVNLTYITSRPSKRSAAFEFAVDFEGAPGQPHVDALLSALGHLSGTRVSVMEPVHAPWFPTNIGEIDRFSTKTLDAGAELEADHPGFHDETYRDRRRAIVENAMSYKYGQEVPRVAYTAAEVDTWATVYRTLRGYTSRFGVAQYNDILPAMERECGYGERNIPQLADISTWLRSQTGWTVRPVGGLLSARDFLNALAFRVFFSTQYIRHHTKPLYTPEPDVVHELLGHAPMFADPDFADFSHEIGLASLGASDEDIKRLATCYWFSVEFGLCLQDGERKAYGAGLLSSFGELEFACATYRPAGGEDKFPEYRAWEPAKAAVQAYPITTYQPVYYVADSLADAKARMRSYCENLRKGFNVMYDPVTGNVSIDRALIRGQYTVTLQT